MRLSASEKYEIIQTVTQSELGVKKTLQELGIAKSTFYKWYSKFLDHGYDGLLGTKKASNRQWNSIPQQQKDLVVQLALDRTDLSSRELAHYITDTQQVFISESSVYRILKERGLVSAPTHILIAASDQFKDKTAFVHQMWQTDFTYFKVVGWGYYYLSTVLDDYSRYIIHWELCSSMKADDVKRTVELAVKKARIKTKAKPKLLSDNGACYISSELGDYLKNTLQMQQVHGRPAHPQTQGKIERYHRTMKNVVKLENFFHPDQLREAIGQFVDRYNNQRYHESLNNLTPADVYFGRGELILKRREQIKTQTLKQRKIQYLNQKLIAL